MSEVPPTHRGDIMRQIAAIEAQIDLLWKSESRSNDNREKQRELKRQIDALWKKLI